MTCFSKKIRKLKIIDGKIDFMVSVKNSKVIYRYE